MCLLPLFDTQKYVELRLNDKGILQLKHIFDMIFLPSVCKTVSYVAVVRCLVFVFA